MLCGAPALQRAYVRSIATDLFASCIGENSLSVVIDNVRIQDGAQYGFVADAGILIHISCGRPPSHYAT